MHIPDGFLSTNVWASAWLVSIGCIGYFLKKTSQILKDRMVPLMGIMSAFIFAAQMLNFPVIGGTSGHLLGGALALVLLGPYAGAIVLASVLIVQCVVFQDGGFTALGANIFNMSIMGTFVVYFVYRIISRVFGGAKGIIIAAAFASWLSVVIASAFCAVELAFSGVLPLRIVFPAMVSVHALIGIGEAVITCFIIGFVLKVRPDLIYGHQEK